VVFLHIDLCVADVAKRCGTSALSRLASKPLSTFETRRDVFLMLSRNDLECLTIDMYVLCLLLLLYRNCLAGNTCIVTNLSLIQGGFFSKVLEEYSCLTRYSCDNAYLNDEIVLVTWWLIWMTAPCLDILGRPPDLFCFFQGYQAKVTTLVVTSLPLKYI